MAIRMGPQDGVVSEIGDRRQKTESQIEQDTKGQELERKLSTTRRLGRDVGRKGIIGLSVNIYLQVYLLNIYILRIWKDLENPRPQKIFSMT
jgi:hypothetical protein